MLPYQTLFLPLCSNKEVFIFICFVKCFVPQISVAIANSVMGFFSKQICTCFNISQILVLNKSLIQQKPEMLETYSIYKAKLNPLTFVSYPFRA